MAPEGHLPMIPADDPEGHLPLTSSAAATALTASS